MSRALAHLEWIEQRSIQANTAKQEVTFGVNDRTKVDLETIRSALPDKYRSVSILKGPTDVEPQKGS